jgi:hypothetical protein
MDSISNIRWTDQCTFVIIMAEIIVKGNAPMELFALLAALLAINVIARRWGVDSRDSCDWGDPRTSHPC